MMIMLARIINMVASYTIGAAAGVPTRGPTDTPPPLSIHLRKEEATGWSSSYSNAICCLPAANSIKEEVPPPGCFGRDCEIAQEVLR